MFLSTFDLFKVGIGPSSSHTAALLALRGNGSYFVPLDSCTETMCQTGQDMKARDKKEPRAEASPSIWWSAERKA